MKKGLQKLYTLLAFIPGALRTYGKILNWHREYYGNVIEPELKFHRILVCKKNILWVLWVSMQISTKLLKLTTDKRGILGDHYFFSLLPYVCNMCPYWYVEQNVLLT